MRSGITAILSALFLVSAASITQAADKFAVGDWTGQALFADNGTFSRCAIEGKYKSGITVNFGLTRDYTVEIWLENPAWKLNKGTGYDVQYWIDSNAHQRGLFNSLGGGFGRIDVDNGVAIFDQLRGGAQLFVTGLGTSETFRLNNTNAALTRLRQCVDTEVQAELERSIAAAPNNQTATAPRSGNTGNDAGNPKGSANTAPDLITALFDGNPSLASFRVLKGNDIPKDMRNEEIVWKAPDATGSANRYTGKTPKQIMRDIVEADRKACTDKFSTTDTVSTLPDGSSVQRFATACPSGKWFVQYSAYEGKGGAWYVIGNFSLDKPDGARQADDLIFSAISGVVRR